MSDDKKIKNTHGGAGRGQGRKPLQPGEESVSVSLRVTRWQKSKLKLLGGAKWIREQISKSVNV